MFGDFDDRDFAKLLLAVESYSRGCLSLVKEAKDKKIPLNLVSQLVNLQRKGYDLSYVNHSSYRDLQLDPVVSGKEYFFNSENLKLALATLITINSDGTDNIDREYTCKIMKEVKKFLSFKIKFNFNIIEYCEIIRTF